MIKYLSQNFKILIFLSLFLGVSLFASDVDAITAPPQTPVQTGGGTQTDNYCVFIQGALKRCDASQATCNQWKDYLSSKGIPLARQNQCVSTPLSVQNDPYPRYCFGVKGLDGMDPCFSSLSACKRVESQAPQQDQLIKPTFGTSQDQATRCVEVAEPPTPDQDVRLENPLKTIDTVYEFVDAIMSVIIGIALPIAFAFLVWAGFLIVFAQGNPGKLDKGKKVLKMTLIGVILILGAKALTTFLTSTFMQVLGR